MFHKSLPWESVQPQYVDWAIDGEEDEKCSREINMSLPCYGPEKKNNVYSADQ
jgi:hypothetical protein